MKPIDRGRYLTRVAGNVLMHFTPKLPEMIPIRDMFTLHGRVRISGVRIMRGLGQWLRKLVKLADRFPRNFFLCCEAKCLSPENRCRGYNAANVHNSFDPAEIVTP